MCQVVPVENLNVVPGAWETLTEVTELSWGTFRKLALGRMAVCLTTREQLGVSWFLPSGKQQ